MARKGQIDLSLQIALGSSTQIALLVAPLLVFVGLFLGQPMNLVFTPFEVAILFLATLVDARSLPWTGSRIGSRACSSLQCTP